MTIATSSIEKNKNIFDQFYVDKERIETSYGHQLEWHRLSDKKSSRIKHSFPVDGYNEENWQEMITWLVEHFPKLEAAFEPEIEAIKR